MEERQLVYLAQQGNKAYLEELLSVNYDKVYYYLLKLTLNKNITEDLCQETMVKAIVNLKKFKGNSKFSTWLITIATNLFKNTYKKNKRSITMSHEDLELLFEPTEDFSDQLVERDMVKNILLYLKDFKPSQSTPFILKHYYGYDLKTISQIMSCPIGTTKSRIHQTITKLQSKFKEDINVKL